MNEKQIIYTNKETGETITGTIIEISKVSGVHRNTIAKHLRKDGYSDDNCIISNALLGKSNAHDLSPNAHTPDSNAHGKNSNAHKAENILDLARQDQRYNTPEPTQTPAGTLPQRPCILCGEPVYHTKTYNNQTVHVCYGKCQPIQHGKPDPIPPDPAKLAYLQQYIRQMER